MTSKLKRRELKTHVPGITKLVVFNDKTGKWAEPKFGKKFVVQRYLSTSDGQLKKLRRSFETMAEAKEFKTGQIEDKPATGNTNGQMTFGELVAAWKRDWLPSKDIATQLRYKAYLKHYAFLWHFVVEKIEPTHIDRWLAHLKTPEYLAQCHSTRCNFEHEFTILRVILNYYSSRFNRNYRLPFIKDHSKMLKVKNTPNIRKDLTVEQLRNFITSLKEICWGTKWEPIYYLALMQYGIYGRIQDAAALSFESFDVEGNKLNVTQKVQWLRVKGYDDRISTGSKANGGKVLSPIPELALSVFQEWTEKSGIQSGLLFQIDGRIITYRQIQNRYTQALERAGLPFTATHVLRHAALTEAYQSCKDLLVVQRFAGQRDLRSTTRYAKVRDDQMTETQKRMDEKLSTLLGENQLPVGHDPQKPTKNKNQAS